MTSPVGGLRIEAGLEDVGDLRVTAISIIVVIVYTVALHVTDSILSLPVVAGPQSKAVPSVVARPRVVALRVALAVPNLPNPTVAEDKLLSEAGVFYSVQAQIQGDVVRAKGLSQSLVLELDLGLWHGGVSAIVVWKVDDPVANSLGGAEPPVVVVAKDDVGVVAGRQAAGWRQEWGD